MFLIASIILVSIAILVVILNPKEEINLWAGACIFVNGIVFSLDHFMFYEYKIIYFILYPYTILMFSVSYTGLYMVPERLKRRFAGIALIPVAIIHAIYTIHPDFRIILPYFPYWILCFFTANALLLYSYITTRSPEIKRNRLLTCVIVVPITTIDLSYNFYHGITQKYIPNFEFFTVITFSIIFTFILFKYDILGASLKLEKSRLNSTIQAMSSGTAFLNHTIKNEIQNIWMYMNKIESGLSKNQALQDNFYFIRNSTNHLMSMVSRIQEQMQQIVLQEAPTRLIDIVEQSINLITPSLQAKNITIVREYALDVTLLCDPIHICEVLCNILKNAIEAMNPGGAITIQISRTNKWLVLAIQDNGAGIPKENLARVFDPFFSTKNQRVNYGLGLSYCYNVMQQHGGLIDIYSEEGKGTTVFLNFRQKKSLHLNSVKNSKSVPIRMIEPR